MALAPMAGAMTAAGKATRCYSLGNHITADDTVLKSKLFAAIFEAVNEGVLEPAEAERCLACFFEFQSHVMTAVGPLLQALDLLSVPAARLQILGDADEVNGPTQAIRDVQARFRDVLAHGLFAHNLGFDSKKQFTALVWRLHSCTNDEGLSSKMQNAYMKIMKTYQDWFQGLDLKSGREVATTASKSSRRWAKRAARSSSDTSSSTSLREDTYDAVTSTLEPMKVPVPEW